MMTLHIHRDGDRLIGQVTGQPPFRLHPESETHFYLRAVAAEVDFRATPLSGVEQDHIYRTRSGSIFDSQSDPSDAILLPIQQ